MVNMLSWLLSSEGITIFDKLLLFFIKFSYLSLRILFRLTLGKKRRDRLYVEKGFDFGVFWNMCFNLFGSKSKGHSAVLKFKVPKYNFEFYCRNNNDDFKIMTIHEQDILDHFIPAKQDVVIDIGAHIGLYTIIASKFVGPNGKVIAIEADPNNFEMLKRNVKLNNLTNVIALNYAVYSREERRMKLYLPGFGFTKYNTVMSPFTKKDESFIEITSNTLDNILSQLRVHLKQIAWMKIDVEGAEFEVLKGAHKTLSEAEEITILMELHGSPHTYEAKVEQFTKLYNFEIILERKYMENGNMHVMLRKSQDNI